MAPQIVLMTGCSSGIGLATAKRLALDPDQRYIVIATVIAMSEKADLEAAIGDVLDKNVFIKKLDITNDDDISSVVDGTLKQYGKIDVLLNIAGMAFSNIPENVSRQQMELIFNVNVFGTIRLTQAVLPHLKRMKNGKIITISSVAGKIAWPYHEFYCSTKFAVEGFFEGLVTALRSFNIRVCLVEPGKAYTNLVDGLNKDLDSAAQDDSANDIDRLQIQGMNDSLNAMKGATADEVAKAITTRCFDVEEPAFRHLLPEDLFDAVRAGAADITGETIVGIMRNAIGSS